ncbi:RNA polymerase factor sigma-70 [Carnobacterium sp. 17-4]|uniref:sigma-70 family RNA polymerase sigma factor n=1 Tax=Carnobacterium sp. (strain 17-4) TaxID=208596 RepID=UPI000205873F|nr:sigma-70 family RNA polymerase sigma factor [Carnobacterium sp. 17-4]AEB31127.1 RNA polymerase factor sigma-70 [Carnobacterium sp. 17-4]
MADEDEKIYFLSDEELIHMIKNGDGYPFKILFERYHPLVTKLTKEYFLKSYELEDLWQEARIVFHKTIQTYDKDKGHTFGNFYKLNFKHHIFSLIRKDMAKKRRIEKIAESLDGMLEKGMSPQYIMNGKEGLSALDILQVKEKLAGYHLTLSKLEQKVFSLYLKNIDVDEIAKLLQCDSLQIKNALDRCKRKMKQILES